MRSKRYWTTRKERIEALLEKAYQTLDTLLSSTAEAYTFDSGSGRQSEKSVDIAKLQGVILTLEQQLYETCQKLNGQTGTVSVRLDRRGGF